MSSIKIFMAIVVMVAAVYAQQPTSFNFDRIRYTFYPGEIARTWPEANAFCKSLGKELAVFANRGQIRNVSEYLSPEGGVWTGYKTNADAKFESVELAEFEWKKEFGTPLLNKAKPKMCGLLSVANYTGIVATDCSTKKAALCSLSNPDAIAAESVRDGKANVEKVTKEAAKPATDAKAKSAKVSAPAKESNNTTRATPSPAPKASTPSPAPKASTPKPTTPAPTSTAVKPTKAAVEKESDDEPKEYKPKSVDAATPAATPKPTSKPAEKKPAAETKPKGDEKVAKSKPAEKAKAKTGDKPKKDDEEEGADEEKAPKPTSRPATNQTPIQIESEGVRFTFFPNHIMFGGYMEYSRFCEDKGLQPAVFTSRSQLEDIATHVNSVVMVWTGYSTDSQGMMHSIDEANGPWQPEFEVAGAGPSQSLMCGALSTAANKVGITLNSCASAHEALCSAKLYAKKNVRK